MNVYYQCDIPKSLIDYMVLNFSDPSTNNSPLAKSYVNKNIYFTGQNYFLTVVQPFLNAAYPIGAGTGVFNQVAGPFNLGEGQQLLRFPSLLDGTLSNFDPGLLWDLLSNGQPRPYANMLFITLTGVSTITLINQITAQDKTFMLVVLFFGYGIV